MRTFQPRSGGMQTFLIIWFGQFVSLSGTAMTRFALLIWAYQQTGQATSVALLGFFGFTPFVLVSPFAGVFVDRWDRRRVMLITDVIAGCMSLTILALYTQGTLAMWHLYVLEGMTGALEAFQINAYTAATAVLVPKRHYGRAAGLRGLAVNASKVGAPFIAGVLVVMAGLPLVLLIDIISFLIAVGTLTAIRIPSPDRSAEGELASASRFWAQVRFGFTYIIQRRGLLFLLFAFTVMNFVASLTYFGILPAMVLARPGGGEIALAAVQSALGAGGVVGGVLMSIWGGPKRRIHGILACAAASFLFGDFLLGTGRGPVVWVLGAFVAAVTIPPIIASDRAIWQSKVPPDVQGRVLAAAGAVRELGFPLGFLIAGPLADRIFGPAMLPGGALANTFGWLVGTGPGAGMGLMFVCTAFIGMTVALSGYLIPAVRNVETDLPDYDAPPSDAIAAEPVLPSPAASAAAAD